jgi:hypothetical protein
VLVDRELVARIESFFARDAAGYALALAEVEPDSGAEVAVCSLSIGDGFADLGGMLTREPWRGRGIQA